MSDISSEVARLPSNSTILHLCIDPQIKYMSGLSASRQKSFPAALRQFADAIYPIPTLWIAIGNNLKVVADALTTPAERQQEERSCGFTFRTESYENIYTKCGNDAFASHVFTDHLKHCFPKTDTVIITGMNTRHCVAETMAGAIAHGFNCLAVYDLMADCTRGAADRRIKWHKSALSETMKNDGYTYGYQLTDSHSLLKRQGKIKPAEAVRPMPVLRLRNFTI